MTHVLLIRHGPAEPSSPFQPDRERSLSSEGAAQTREAMAGLVRLGFRPERGLGSPYLRAQQTLRLLQEAYASLVPETWEGCRPESPVGRALDELSARMMEAPEIPCWAIVSHEPFCSGLVEAATGLCLEFGKAACAVLEIKNHRWFFLSYHSREQLRNQR